MTQRTEAGSCDRAAGSRWVYNPPTRSSQHHEMKVARTVLLICLLLGSLGLPIFFLLVRHFHLESETAEWLVSLWPRSLGEVALEDRRAAGAQGGAFLEGGGGRRAFLYRHALDAR